MNTTNESGIEVARPRTLDELRECIGRVVETQFYKQKPGSYGRPYVLGEKEKFVLDEITEWVYFLSASRQSGRGKFSIFRQGTLLTNLVLRNGVIRERKNEYCAKVKHFLQGKSKGRVWWDLGHVSEGTDAYNKSLKKLIEAGLVTEQGEQK